MKGANSIDQVKNMANAVSDSVKHITSLLRHMFQ